MTNVTLGIVNLSFRSGESVYRTRLSNSRIEGRDTDGADSGLCWASTRGSLALRSLSEPLATKITLAQAVDEQEQAMAVAIIRDGLRDYLNREPDLDEVEYVRAQRKRLH